MITPVPGEWFPGLPVDVLGQDLADSPGLMTNINVKNYGAVGNDITFDNLAAINAAMAAATTTGGVVYFPAGDFRFSAPIALLAPITGAGPTRTQLRPLASATGSFAIDMNAAGEQKFVKNLRISGAGTKGCVGSTNDGKGSSLTLFENVWFTDTSTANYAVGAESTTSGAGSLTGAVFLRCSWDNTPHMVRVGDNQDDTMFIGCRFNMLAGNQPNTAPILLRGQNIKQIGCFYNLHSTATVATPVKEFIQVGAHVVSIENAFFEVQGGSTTNFTHLVWAAEPVCHLSMRDITYRRTGTSSMTKAVYTEAVAGTIANDSVIELKNWRILGGTLATAVDIKVASPAASRLFDFSGIDTFSALVTTATGSTSAAAADYLRLTGEWRGTAYGHTVSHDAALTLSYTSALLGRFDFPPVSVDPRAARPTDVAVVGTTTNTALYYRVRDGGTISKIALEVTTSNGNLSVGVYSNTGVGRSAAPAAQKATSGSVACPAIGVQEIALTGSVRVEPGDWIAISSDSTTAAFRSTITAEQTTALGNGICYKQATAHPLPATPGTLTGISGRNILLVGTP
jgi:hypothetical protein